MSQQTNEEKNEEKTLLWEQQVEHECIHRNMPQSCPLRTIEIIPMNGEVTKETDYIL